VIADYTLGLPLPALSSEAVVITVLSPDSVVGASVALLSVVSSGSVASVIVIAFPVVVSGSSEAKVEGDSVFSVRQSFENCKSAQSVDILVL